MSGNGKVLLAALAAGLVGLGASLWMHGLPPPATRAAKPAPPGGAVATVGELLPHDLVLRDLSGTSVNVQERFGGRPLLVNFWASWCGPCIEEMPELQHFFVEQAGNVQVLGIALDEPAQVAAFLQRLPVDYPILLDQAGPGDSSVRLGNDKGVLPYSVLVGADGRILKRKLGPFKPGEIAGWAAQARGDGPGA